MLNVANNAWIWSADSVIDHRGEYLEIAPPQRLVFSLAVEGEPHIVSRVEIAPGAVRLQAEGAANAPLMARLATAYACEVYARVAEDAVQLHGGIGFTWEHDCHLFLKRAKLNQALLGGTAAQLDAAADLLLAR